ncbi:hypothetical protein Hanom_Chr16g01430721 [Helianthus anomalus]
MAAIQWTEEEDIALCELWVEALSHYMPRSWSSGPFWGRLLQHFSVHRGNHTRAINTLSFRIMKICMDCKRLEQLHTAVEHQWGDLGEDDTIQIALINYRHEVGCEFKHVSKWKIIRFFI